MRSDKVIGALLLATVITLLFSCSPSLSRKSLCFEPFEVQPINDVTTIRPSICLNVLKKSNFINHFKADFAIVSEKSVEYAIRREPLGYSILKSDRDWQMVFCFYDTTLVQCKKFFFNKDMTIKLVSKSYSHAYKDTLYSYDCFVHASPRKVNDSIWVNSSGHVPMISNVVIARNKFIVEFSYLLVDENINLRYRRSSKNGDFQLIP